MQTIETGIIVKSVISSMSAENTLKTSETTMSRAETTIHMKE